MSALFNPLRLGALTVANRVIMAPLTRTRAGRSHIPNDLMAEYYAQRASAGLVFTECSMVSADASAFIGEGGIFDDTTAAGWKIVADAVHAAGGQIAMQIWHPGRAAHSGINGVQPVSSSNQAIRNAETHTLTGKQPYEAPRPLCTEEIPAIVAQFADAAERARAVGIDAVQIHAAHGYLIDQFLRDSVNDRADAYGGSLENRARFLLEIVDAVSARIGADRVGVRISPLVPFNDIADSDPAALVAYVAQQLSQRGVGHLEMRHEQHDRPEEVALLALARKHFAGPLLVNGGFDPASAEAVVAEGRADAVVFGKAFIANPDLPARIAAGATLNAVDFATLYSPGPKGYTDYPRMTEGA